MMLSNTETVEETTQETIQETAPEVTPEKTPVTERPEWVLDKYATEGRSLDEAIQEQAKAYVELQKKFGGFTGAPEEYEFTLPEGIEGEIDTELPQYKKFVEIAKSGNMSQEMANSLVGLFAEYQYEMEQQMFPPIDQLKAQLGDNADQLISAVNQYAVSNLSQEAYKALDAVSGTMYGPGIIKAFNEVIAKTRNSPVINAAETVKAGGFTEADFREAVKSDRYRNDAQYRAEIRKKAAHLFPGLE